MAGFAMKTIVFSMMILWITLAGNGAHKIVRKKSASRFDIPDETNEDYSSASDNSGEDGDEPTVFSGKCDSTTKHAESWRDLQISRAMLIDFLSVCTRDERRNIGIGYWNDYHEDFARRIKELITGGGLYDEALRFAQMSGNASELLASKLRDATELRQLDYGLLRLILTPLTEKWKIFEALKIYEFWFGENLSDVLQEKSKNDPNLWSVLELQLEGRRDDEVSGDSEKIAHSAHKIRRYFGSDNSGKSDDFAFREILLTGSYDDLREIAYEFRRTRGKNLTELIENSELSANAKRAYVDVVDYSENQDDWFAKKLNEAILADRIDMETIIFIISWRAEIDLGNIKDAYKSLYDISLYNSIKGVIVEKDDKFFRDVLFRIIGQH